MKQKIYTKLKQEYSSLGLGDEVLQAQAESLASTGLVTDVNLDAVVGAQKTFLEGLQKANDKRVSDAVKKAAEKAEEERKKEETRKAEEEAKRKAEEEKKAEEERQKAEEEEKRKAEEEAKKKLEDEKSKSNEVIEALKQMLQAQQEKLDKFTTDFSEQTKRMESSYEEKFAALKAETDAAKAAEALRQRNAFITNTAKTLGIPQYRIDEGFNIGGEDTEEQITEFLTKVSNNIKLNTLPKEEKEQLGDEAPSKELLEAVAKSLSK